MERSPTEHTEMDHHKAIQKAAEKHIQDVKLE